VNQLRDTTHSQLLIPLLTTVVLTAAASVGHAGDRWQWSLTPYIWASDISEDLILSDEIVGGGDTEFKDLVELVDTSLQLHFEGVGDRWGLFADLTYIDLSDSETGELAILRFDVEITEALLEAGAIYRPGGRSGKLDLLFGVRYLSVDEKYRLQLGELDPFETAVDEGYLDALIGARYNIPLSERWVISLRGDLSLGGTDYTWTAHGLVGWRFGAKRNSAVFLGYQYRDMEYSKVAFEVEKTLSGPGIGVKIGF
jgi:hypothetical protein